MVGVSASVNLPLHHKVQKFSSGTGSPGWSRTKGRKTVMVWCFMFCILYSVSTKKMAPLKYNGVEIITTEFSIYFNIVCNNSWKFNVKIVFYYTFSITRSKHKFP